MLEFRTKLTIRSLVFVITLEPENHYSANKCLFRGVEMSIILCTYMCFIDFKKPFDKVIHDKLIGILQ